MQGRSSVVLRSWLVSVLVHLAIGFVGLAAIWMATGNQGVLDADVLTRFGIDNPQAVQAYRDEARAGAITWWGAAALASLALALAWLLLCALRDPSTPQEARSAGPMWALGLLLVLLAAFLAGYLRLVPVSMNSAYRIGIFSAGLLGVLLAYLFGTALAVKASMIPSVPLASMMRR